MCKLARVRHSRGDGAVWLGCQGEPWVLSGSSCDRLSVTQGENGSATPTTHPTVSEIMRKLRYRDPQSTIATFGKKTVPPRQAGPSIKKEG